MILAGRFQLEIFYDSMILKSNRILFILIYSHCYHVAVSPVQYRNRSVSSASVN